MIEFLLAPPLLLMFGSVVLAAAPRNVLPRTVLRALLLALPVYSLWRFWGLEFGDYARFDLFGQTLTLMRIDGLSRIFAVIFHLAALIGTIYSFYAKDNFQPLVGVFYAGSALGVVLAGDLWTLFLFWEVAAVSSALLVWVRRSGKAAGAGLRYLGMQMVSGVLLLAGIVLLRHEVGAAPGWAEFRNLTGFLADGGLGLSNLAATLIFLAFGLKAAFPLLHSWLIDAYPESTPAGAVFLSAFTTKFAIYALARAFPGQSELIWIGALMTAFPIFFAVIENDLRRVLAYSMTNQLGFMVVGIGIGTELAINGAVAHAFADILFKGLLFMAMGAVLYRVGHVNGSDLGGLYKSMPITTGLCIIGAASISAFPLFSAFATKSLIMSAAVYKEYFWLWLVLLFASAGVFHHAGIKIPFFAFFHHDSGIRCKEAPRSMLVAMVLAAAASMAIGLLPLAEMWFGLANPFYELLPYQVHYEAYTTTHVITQSQLLFFSALAFATLMRTGLYPPELRSVNLDADWFYRRVGYRVWDGVATAFVALHRTGYAVAGRLATAASATAQRHLGPQGLLGRSWLTASMALWVAVLLAAYLLVFYWRLP
ncbi:MAG: Na(+)/H(+) antiporter subunit D [Acidobacteria bacterium]|nr:Na(+)/H(+) antiporter subunit D [Acidobacteriota bacterium]